MKVGATTTHYVYGANGLLYGEYSSTGTLVREYVYLNDAPLAQIATGSPEVLTYLHTDHLGTPRYATNTAGTQVWAWPSDAFGISTPTGTVMVNLRMPGQYFDTESGNFYNWNRYYNPNIGRYISPDPIGQEGGLNLFSYVGQSPLMASDPMGLCDEIQDGKIQTGCVGARPVYPIETAIAFLYGRRAGVGYLGGLLNPSRQVSESLIINGVQCKPRPDLAPLAGGRSGANVKNLAGPPNSAIRGSSGRIYITDKNGKVISEITATRAKDVSPGQGFIRQLNGTIKRDPTAQELELLKKFDW